MAPTRATFRIWRGDATGGEFRRLPDRGLRGHGRARRRAPDPGRAGQRSGGALELQGRQVRIVLGGSQRQPAADVHDAAEPARPARQPVTVEPMRAFPLIRDLVTDVSWNYQAKKSIRKFKPRPPDARRRHVADGSRRTSSACRSSASASSASSARTSATCCAITGIFDEFVGPRHLRLRRGARDASARRRGSRRAT